MHRLLLLTIVNSSAWACTCAGFPSAKEAWLDSPLVFVGLVERTDPTVVGIWSGEQRAWVRVQEPFKGVRKDQVLELRDRYSSCFGGFRDGSLLLFYLHPGEAQDTWRAPACHRTRGLSYAADDLRFLRGLPDSARGNRVSGVVGLWQDDPANGPYRSRELGGVRVRAVGASGTFETDTDTQGLYEFRDLPPGTYLIKIDYPPGTTLRYSSAYGRTKPGGRFADRRGTDTQLEVSAESGNGFDFNLAPDTRITGRVLGPGGRPLKDVCLEAAPLQGNPSSRSRISDCTEADGSYAIEKLPAGSYRIVANPGGQKTAAAPFGPLYYPGTPELEKAGVLTVVAGQHLTGADIQVPRLAPRIELSGRLIFSNGVPLAGQSLTFDSTDNRYHEYSNTDALGNFRMQVLSGQTGSLLGRIFIFRDVEHACPQFNAKFSPEGHGASLLSSPFPVAGDKSLSGIEVIFPFPSCDAWVKRYSPRGQK